MAEKHKQLEDQKKLADEVRHKADQGLVKLQGEVQELILEELLRNRPPFGLTEALGKGVRGTY